MKHYPYRFKTEKEFTKEYGYNWRASVGFNDEGEMDYLIGTDFPFEELPTDSWIELDYWSIGIEMLTDNEPIVPNYKSRKIDRTI